MQVIKKRKTPLNKTSIADFWYMHPVFFFKYIIKQYYNICQKFPLQEREMNTNKCSLMLMHKNKKWSLINANSM